MTKNIGILALEGYERGTQIASEMRRLLTAEGITVHTYARMEQVKKASSEDVDDLLVVIGGDGTILKAFLTMEDSPLPVLSIGIGRRNFLATTEHTAAEDTVARILSEDYALEEAMRLDVKVGRLSFPPVLNEVYLTSFSPGVIVDTRVEVAAQKAFRVVWRDLADGVMVSTPIGSTAYSLSAGGPIIDTSLDTMTVTPVAPIIYKASIVLSGEDRVTIWADSTDDLALVFDGQFTEKVKSGQKVMVQTSDSPAQFVTFDEDPRVSRMIRAFRVKR